jgi:hypothetical protein
MISPTRKKIFIGVLAGAALLIYVPMFFRDTKSNTEVVEAEGLGPAAEPPPPPGGPKGADREASKPSIPVAKRDGGAPAAKRDGAAALDGLFSAGRFKAGEADGDPKVTSVVSVGSDRMAVVDGQIVRAGDTWKGRRVAEVREDGVVLRSKDETMWVALVDAGVRAGDTRQQGAKDTETQTP